MSIYRYLILFIWIPNSIFGTVYYVDDSGADTRTTQQSQSSTTPWKTIGYAISQVSSGYTINVGSGSYAEQNLVINKSIVLQGAGIDLSIITGNGLEYNVFGIQAGGAGGKIDGFTMNNSGAAQIINITSVNNFTISNNKFSHTGTNDIINLWGDNTNRCSNITIKRNRFINNGTSMGIAYYYSKDSIISNNIFLGRGIWINTGSQGGTVSNNTFYNNSDNVGIGNEVSTGYSYAIKNNIFYNDTSTVKRAVTC